MPFNSLQRDRLQDALLNRAEDTNTPKLKGRLLRSAANERWVFDRLIEAKEKELRRAHPNASDGQIFKMLLDWINSGGLKMLIEAIAALFTLFAKRRSA